jgi:hypothetical protein
VIGGILVLKKSALLSQHLLQIAEAKVRSLADLLNRVEALEDLLHQSVSGFGFALIRMEGGAETVSHHNRTKS